MSISLSMVLHEAVPPHNKTTASGKVATNNSTAIKTPVQTTSNTISVKDRTGIVNLALLSSGAKFQDPSINDSGNMIIITDRAGLGHLTVDIKNI